MLPYAVNGATYDLRHPFGALMLSQRTIDRIKGIIYDQQFSLIRKKYGEAAAHSANYGHGVETADDYVNISTKIYGFGYLVTMATSTRDIQHKFVENAT